MKRKVTIKQSPLDEERTLMVSHVQSYGRDEYRPENASARFFCELLGQVNLSPKNIEVIKKYGMSVTLKGGRL